MLGRRRLLGALLGAPLLLGLSACADSDSFDFRPSGRCGRGCVGATDHADDAQKRREGLSKAEN